MSVFTDNLNRADAANLGSQWDAGYTGCDPVQIVSQAGRSTNVATQAVETINSTGIVLGNNQYGQLVIAGSNYGGVSSIRDDIIVLLRASAGPANTWYEFTAAKNATFTSRIVYRNAGSGTVINSENATTWAVGDVLRGEVSGTTLTLYRNGSVLLTGTDSNLSSGRGGVSIIIQSGGLGVDEAVIDTLEFGDLGTTSSLEWMSPKGELIPQGWRPGMISYIQRSGLLATPYLAPTPRYATTDWFVTDTDIIITS